MRRLLLAVAGLMICSPANAQTRQSDAAITVEQSVGVSEISRMVFNSTTTTTTTTTGASAPPPEEAVLGSTRTMMADEPAVIQISGDPGRAYRIYLPQSISDPDSNATITGFTVWSRNSGDITETLSGKMDHTGHDTLRVAGVISAVTFSEVRAAVPVTVNYE